MAGDSNTPKKTETKKKTPAKKPRRKSNYKPVGNKNPTKPFQPGNKFWEARSKHGRDMIFATPELMGDAAREYYEWNNENPLYDYQASGGEVIRVPKMRAMTMQGLTRFLGVNSKYFAQFKRTMNEEILTLEQVEKPNEEQKNRLNILYDFSNVITGIEEMVFEHKFTGAAAGFLNANLISRDLGMLDKKEINHTNAGGAFQGQVTVFHLPDNGRPVMQQATEEPNKNQEAQQ